MNASEAKKKTVTFGIFLLPLILVKGTALMLGQGLDPAIGNPVGNNGAATAPTIEPAARVWTEQQLAATRYIERLRKQDFGPSPLLHQKAAPTQNNIEPTDTHRDHPPPQVGVQMILKSSRGNIALIDGKRYRVGDKIGDGWIVTVIDADARSVLIKHTESGEEATLVVPLPR